MPDSEALKTNNCQYHGPNGETCRSPKEIGEHCFWHDDAPKKDCGNLSERLEARAATGEPMTGFCLRNADLSGVNLVRRGYQNGYQLEYSDLYRANLNKAHLFKLDLTGSSLMKANLSGANLNCAKLEKTNLLGTKLENCKLDNVQWSKQILQEQDAKNTKDFDLKMDYLEQAEEIYRNLRRTHETQGLFENAGNFFKSEMTMRRYQLPKASSKRMISKMVDLFCGYGEEPARVILFSMLIIFTFAIVYFFMGITDGDAHYSITTSESLQQILANILRSLYFSVVTFTTVGYGDLAPVGLTRLFAAVEAFVGSFTLALFVVVFVKKMTR
ncbi:MAG: pentapeptide repeat-containing protein [Agarilytica sp.]